MLDGRVKTLHPKIYAGILNDRSSKKHKLEMVKKKFKKSDINISKKETRLEQMKKNPYKRVDSENMTEIEKMDKGFNGKTFSINGMDIDF